MESTRIPSASDPADRVAQGYSGVVARPIFRMPGLEGAGALRSTVEDLLTFLAFNLGFQESPLRAALADTIRRRTATAYPGVAIGLAWLLVDLPGGQAVYHPGDTPGSTAFVGFHPAKRLGVVVLSNARVNSFSSVQDLGLNLLDPQSPLTTIRPPVAVDVDGLMDLAGIYVAPDGDTFEVGWIRDRLVAFHVRSNFEMTLYPESGTRFTPLDLEIPPGTSAVFVRGAEGGVTAMRWTQSGTSATYSRRGGAAKVALERSGGRTYLSMRGGGDAAYDIQASSNLREWSTVGAVGGAGERVEDPGPGDAGLRFYRALRRR
jgi:hypothetical protein